MPTFTDPHPLTAAMEQVTPVQGLLPYLDTAFGATWEHLQVKNFGFQQPGTFDPTRNGSGWRSPNGRSRSLNAHKRQLTETIELGKIFPLTKNTDGAAPFDVSWKVEQAIVSWLCSNGGEFRLVTDLGQFNIEKQRRIWQKPGVQNEKWHILMWSFDLETYG